MKLKRIDDKLFEAMELTDDELSLITGGQSVTQPASVSGTLGQTVTISCSGTNSNSKFKGTISLNSILKVQGKGKKGVVVTVNGIDSEEAEYYCAADNN